MVNVESHRVATFSGGLNEIAEVCTCLYAVREGVDVNSGDIRTAQVRFA
jgi:hypothetical protein